MKKCKGCGEEIELLDVWDDPNVGYAFNVFLCGCCGNLYKVNVWKDAGALEITLEGVVRRLPDESRI